jgi:hypothetical protein
MTYGEQRFTNDIDVLIDLQPQQVDAFCAEFPDSEYYLSRATVDAAVRKRFQFNIIHPASGLKIDCILTGHDAFSLTQLGRAQTVARSGSEYSLRIASPEDVILKKLEYFKLGESEKHVRDICGIIKTQGPRLDGEYIRQWAHQMGLEELWDAMLLRVAEPWVESP